MPETIRGLRRDPKMTIDPVFAVETARELVRIDSRNPALETGGPGELDLARHVETILRGFDGWDVELHGLAEGRANVVAVRRGARDGPSLMLNVHLDTVGVEGMESPFSATLQDGRIYGRGAQDTKGGMAAVLAAARALSDAGARLAGDLVLAFVADEEHESLGTAALLEIVRTDAAIVIEPTDLDVCVAHRGFAVYELRTGGRTAHGGRSDLGIDANLRMGGVLAGLDALNRRWAERPSHARIGPPALHVPVLRGGRHLYVYADECVARVECRTVPGQTEAEVRGELRSILDELGGRIDGFEATLRPIIWRGPYEIDPDRPIVRAVAGAAQAVRGAPARLIGHAWWEDSALLGEAGIDAVVLGPRGEGLHTDREWVDAASIVELAEMLRRSTVSYCGDAG